MDINRRKIGIRTFVCQLEQILIKLLAQFNISASTLPGAPGVYVDGMKIASVGLRVKNGCTYHGIALNVAMDLSPFSDINPCGYSQLQMTQMKQFIPSITVSAVSEVFVSEFSTLFGR